jgi:hypothetical protein
MINYLLNGNVADPLNREDIAFRIDYSDRNRISEFEITVDNLIFVNKDREAILQWMSTYGNGVGMPLTIQFSNGVLLPYFIDFLDEGTTWNEQQFSAKIKRYLANLNFFDNAKGLNWRVVYQNPLPNDFTEVRYIVIPEQQPLYFITLSLSLFSTAQLLAQSIQDIAEGVADVQQASTPIVVVTPTGPGVGPNTGAIISASIKLAARIAKAIALTAALVNLLQTIIEMVMPKVRRMLDIPYFKLIQKGCEHLGYTLDISDLQGKLNPLTFLGTPERALDGKLFTEIFAPMSLQYTNGFPTEMDSIRTLGEAIERIEELFNLRTTVGNGVVRIERRLNATTSPITLQLSYNEQERKLNNRKFNNGVWKRKVLHWTKDVKDMWTFDDKKGHLAELDTKNDTMPDPNLNLIKGAVNVANPFSLGSRKDELTRVEKFLLNVLAPAVDLFTGGNFSATIENRVGVLVVSSQYFSNNKLLWKTGDKIAENHRDQLNAKRILQEWHGSESVANRNKEVIEDMPVRMTEDIFLQLSNQNNVTLSNGEVGEIVTLEWSESRASATATLLVESEFNTNTSETVIYGSGY